MSDQPSNNSMQKAYKVCHHRQYRHRCIQNPAATSKTAQQNDRESDSSKITHMHIDAIHTYERSTTQQFDSQGLQGVPSLSVSPSV